MASLVEPQVLGKPIKVLSPKDKTLIEKFLNIAQYKIQRTIEGNPHADFEIKPPYEGIHYIHPDISAGFIFHALPIGYISLDRVAQFIQIDPNTWTTINKDHLRKFGDPFATFIIKGLYLGSVMHIEPKYLSYLRVKFIVSIMELESLPVILKDKLSSEDAQHASEFSVSHIDVKDDGSPAQKNKLQLVLDKTVDELHHNIESGNTCFVHCLYGISRSSTIVAAYLIKYKKFTVPNAIGYISSLRPQVSPKFNFMMLLNEYEKQFQ